MPSLMTLLAGGGEDADSCRHGIPHRVNTSMAFVAMMRQTAVRPAYEGGPVAEARQTQAETGAYNAALDCLRTYFNGENFTSAAERGRTDDPDEQPPAAAGPTPAPVSPAPAPVPVGQR